MSDRYSDHDNDRTAEGYSDTELNYGIVLLLRHCKELAYQL